MYLATTQERQFTRFERQTSDGKTIWRTDYFGPSPSPRDSNSVRPDAANGLQYTAPSPGEHREPQAFLVEQSAGAVVHPHFHFVDQFQVVVDGDGKLGSHPVRPVTVHFAAGHTGYGPILPGAQGLKYFTLRASADETGAQYLPANRHKMLRLPKKYLLLDPVDVQHNDQLRTLSGVKTHDVYADQTGLKVQSLCAGPSQAIQVKADPASPGVTVIVLAGQARQADKSLDRWSCAFVGPTDEGLTFQSDLQQGFQLLVLQYPSSRVTTN